MNRWAAPLLALALFGCGQSMRVQHHATANGQTDAWASGAVARPLPEGVVAQGDRAYRAAEQNPPHATPALLERGRERYGIFCSECHGYTGAGDGMVVRRGYPKPPSFETAEALGESAGQIYGAIANGKGIMFSYAAEIAPADRWAIVAYIRALQLSQQARSQGSAAP
ncbi:MAG: c-type cytochrome [Rhizomicrobium sp.]